MTSDDEDRNISVDPDVEIDGEFVGDYIENSNDPNVALNVLAQISHYTERPDLFLKIIEEHAPGFIAEIAEQTKEMTAEDRDEYKSRAYFGRVQAYVSLTIQVIGALGALGAIFYMIGTGQAGFFVFVAIGILYAITQGGADGFRKLISACASVIQKQDKGSKSDED